MPERNHFTDFVNDVPALPDDLYNGINRKIRTTIIMKRALYTIAAVVLLSLVPFTMQQLSGTDTDYETAEATLQTDVQSELELVSAYLNSEDLEDFDALYTVVDSY